MNNIGGNLPILLEPVRKATSFQDALAIFYAGAYLVSKYHQRYHPNGINHFGFFWDQDAVALILADLKKPLTVFPMTYFFKI